jgi:opine dehydrogenase
VLPIVVWGTTVVTARRAGDCSVTVNTVRQKVDVATLPHSAAKQGHALCTALFGDRFVPRDGVMAITLSNLNPQNHLGIALLNLTRMEKGEVWGQGEHVTPAVGRVIEALDLERLAIAQALGLQVRTVQQHFSLSFHVPQGTVSAMNQEMHRQGRGGLGPATAESRYVLEDVPYGLCCTTLLGRLAGRPAVLHEAGIALMSAAYGRDLAALNDLAPAVGLATLPLDELLRICRDGYPPAKRDADTAAHR